MNIEIQKLTQSDIGKLNKLLEVYADVFEMTDFNSPSDSYLADLLTMNHIIFFVALKDNVVIGGLTAYVLPSPYSQSAELYVYDVAVNAAYQRQGIGTKLMDAINRYCKDYNFKHVFVQADSRDAYAVDFYRRIGGVSEYVVQFTYELN